MSDDKFLRIETYDWLLSCYQLKKSITEKSLFNELGEENGQLALLLLDYLIYKGHAVSIQYNNSKQYNIIKPDIILEYLNSTKDITKEISKIPTLNSLVISYPPALRNEIEQIIGKYKKDNFNILTLNQAVKSIIEITEKELFLSMPFLESDGLIRFLDEFELIAKKNISLYLLTREVSPSYGFRPNIDRIEAILKIIETFEGRSNIEVREYGSRISSGNKSFHFEGLHQKMIIADNNYCYVGSGEIRAKSILANGEAGFIQSGKEVEFWKDFFMVFWNNARDIPLEYFKNYKCDE